MTDAFYSEEWARDLYSFATPEEEHTPMQKGGVNMDIQFAHNFISIVQKKFTLASYGEVYERFGPGILVVGVQSPWLMLILLKK